MLGADSVESVDLVASPVSPSTHAKGYERRFSICNGYNWHLLLISSGAASRSYSHTLFFLSAPPLSLIELFCGSASSTLKLTLDAFLRSWP